MTMVMMTGARVPAGWAGVVAAAVVLLGAMGLGGCSSRASRLETLYTQAQSDRHGAAVALAAAIKDRKLTYDDALSLAHERIEARDDAIGFSAAVLEAGTLVNDRLPKQAEYELFWVRIGQLAGRAAARARDRGDREDALALVEAGPAHWKSESYWRLHPAHDALAAYLLAETGKKNEAMQRLRSRAELIGEAEEAYEVISKGK